MLPFSRLLLELKCPCDVTRWRIFTSLTGATESELSGSSVAEPHLDNEVNADLILTPRHRYSRWRRSLGQLHD